MVAQVIVEIRAADVDRVFDYAIPEGMPVQPGCRVSVPFGSRTLEGYVLRLAEKSALPAGRLRPIGRILDDKPALLPALLDLADWMTRRYHGLQVEALRLMIPAQMRGERVHAQELCFARLLVSPEEALDALRKNALRQREAVELMAQAGGEVKAEPLELYRSLAEKGLVSLNRERVYRTPAQLKEKAEEKILTGEQQRAVEAISSALDAGRGRFLLHGITGSGKTEVYLRCAAQALEKGRGVMILVPEIALTPQMVARFSSHFGATAAVLHSRLSPGERLDEWQRIRDGLARVVVGARSAIFAPMEHPGLIVVDEEHEPSYRAENRPCYDAIEVAEERCAREGAVLVLGSATPLVDRYRRALNGEYTLLTLKNRASAAARLPEVELVDMCRELQKGNPTVLSARLQEALKQCVARGQQAILFLNRRGYSTFVSCRNCGFVVKCDYCDLPMTYHQRGEKMVCHYCGSEKPVPHICPDCSSKAIRYFGGGTQRVEESVARLLPDTKILRMDADTTSGKDGYLKIYEAFRHEEAQVLVGTQMIAKGLDFPKVTLVGVVAADASLSIPDYHSAERTFQLIEQVAGRAGRAKDPGHVIVQCYQKDHFVLQTAARHDYAGFYQQEILNREACLFPPFSRFLRLVVAHEDEETGRNDMEYLLTRLREAVAAHPDWEKNILLMDAMPAPMARIRAQWRFQVLVKVYPKPFGKEIEDRMAALAAETPPGSSRISFETDPRNMI